ncbi:TldD/PmbA family protein [Pseudomonas aeruginosa]|uniref:TldD/PmbA family protein n=1 Tax=Pseudomonas aeruginosa TaxID=287 RepID=UPI0008723B3F|nr:TldD/PmbA family protein [Pseudomonas aeruginosa]OFB88386.1 peptidase C69 [Pseudomonas aeruginosa]
MIDPLKHRFAALRSRAEFHSLRYVQRSGEYLSVRRNVSEPPHFSQDRGAMLCVRLNGVEAYAATNDLSAAGLQAALEQAERQAERIARHALFDVRGLPPASGRSQYRSPNQDAPFPSLAECYELLAEESAKVPRDERLVNWSVFLEVSRQEQLYLNSAGAEQYHEQRFVYPGASVTAYDGHQLLAAPNTPSGRCDLLLMPDQMILQIHESIGHPLELDRILGDERNYAGTSFIKTEDFGRYQYGSSLLNVSFDPEIPEELASYRQDDDGSPARKEYLIREGRLLRPLGGALSQHRSGLEGVASSRASSWNRAPIDRMANLNLEPGDKSFAQLVAGIERGVLMSYNRSWSIDDARNKFQFGCEWGQLIEDGELKGVVKNPNYRGISAQFWRNLSAVGDAGTFEVLGTPYCGKGEPNQVIRVGHASPACVFSDVDVFGGDT